ncbi:VOC family protein [Halovenus salina]|uniref:VOC family protein n=1 Tax=Halovenus salina TaxID=1510225 RepID=UPI0022610303|nr:VOC family protein [Halovenus salina]
MGITVDHLPFACTDLEATAAEFERLGLEPEYGGVHDNGCTHMSVLGFEDGSYVELIAERDRGDHGFWPEHIRADAGPAAWCVRVPDIVAECHQYLDTGVTVSGPLYGSREREDGRLVEWDRAEFGTGDRRLLFPFAIEDRTPLSYRVSPSPSVAGGPLTGIGVIVLLGEDPETVVEALRERYRWPEPVTSVVEGFGTVASVPGVPVAAVGPETERLAARLEQFPPGPCACLLATDDLDAAREAHPLGETHNWPDGRVAFFESEQLGRRLGVVERAP